MAEKDQAAKEWKFQDMHAPVGSPLNFIQMKNSSRSSNKRDQFNPNRTHNGVNLYPFPIEDADRTEQEHDFREFNKNDAREALLN